MSKAILVMDMPESCAKCPMCKVATCMAKKYLKITYCPLKPVPEKVDIPYLATWDCGWNACIDEILKEGE